MACAPESAAEAAATRDLLARHGIDGAILPGPAPSRGAGLQEAARTARYRLLRDECRRRGILHLLLAHHADDQAETVAMRAARRSGPDGLAGMAALVEQPEVRLLRPLLGVPRARLTATLLRARRAVARRSLERRSALRTGAAAGERLPRVAERSAGGGVERAVRDGKLARPRWICWTFDPAGAVAIDRTGFARLGRDLQARLLSRVIQAVGGRDHPPRRRAAGAGGRPALRRRGRAESRAKGRISRFPAAG